MEIKTPISNVSQEKLKQAMRPVSRNTSTYIFKQNYILVTTLSINGVSDFVEGPRMRNFRVTTARKTCWSLHIFIPMEADLSICSSGVGWNSKQRWPDRVSLT